MVKGDYIRVDFIDAEDGGKPVGLSWWARNQSAIRIFGVGFIWLVVGIMYGQLYEDWTFIQCIYFAVAACSTAGTHGTTDMMH